MLYSNEGLRWLEDIFAWITVPFQTDLDCIKKKRRVRKSAATMDFTLHIHALGSMKVILFGQIPSVSPDMVAFMALPGAQFARPAILMASCGINTVVGTMPFDTFFQGFIEAYNRIKTCRLELVKLAAATAARFVTGQVREYYARPHVTTSRVHKILSAKCLLAAGLETAADLVEAYSEEEAHSRFLDSKARVIQRRFRDVVSDPYHPVGNRRLMFEFHKLTRHCTLRDIES
jgi:hypothetical protein